MRHLQISTGIVLYVSTLVLDCPAATLRGGGVRAKP
jgi:hypothetical protein